MMTFSISFSSDSDGIRTTQNRYTGKRKNLRSDRNFFELLFLTTTVCSYICSKCVKGTELNKNNLKRN